MALDREAEPPLKCDTSGAEKLAPDDRWTKEPEVGGFDGFVGVPNAQIRKSTDIPGGFGAIPRDKVHLGAVAKKSPKSKEEIEGAMFSPLEPGVDLVLDFSRGVVG